MHKTLVLLDKSRIKFLLCQREFYFGKVVGHRWIQIKKIKKPTKKEK